MTTSRAGGFQNTISRMYVDLREYILHFFIKILSLPYPTIDS